MSRDLSRAADASAIAPTLQREFFERDVGIPLTREAETGKLFPVSNCARGVRDGLIELARRRGVQFQCGTSLTGLAPASRGWRVETSRGEIHTRAVVLATGIHLAARLGHVGGRDRVDSSF